GGVERVGLGLVAGVLRLPRLRSRGGGAARGLLGALLPAPFTPALRVGRGNRRLDDLAPVEDDAGILLLERAAHALVERLASDLDVGRRAEPVQHARARLAATVGRGFDEIEML